MLWKGLYFSSCKRNLAAVSIVEREKGKLICVLHVFTNRQDSTYKNVAAVVKRNLAEKAH